MFNSNQNINRIHLPLIFPIAACTGFKCPPGSECKVCGLTNTAYCDFSCSIDNGGCPEDETCTEVAVPCPPGVCCSANITCGGSYVLTCKFNNNYVVYSFKQNYFICCQQWTMCYQNFPHGNTDTNIYVEAFHNRIKIF